MPYTNPSSLLIGTVVLEALAVTLVALRFYTRYWKRTPPLVSDWLILVALVFGTGLTALEIYGVSIKVLAFPAHATMEDHAAFDYRMSQARHIMKAFFPIGIIGLGLIKTSVSLLYLNLFSADLAFRRAILVWTAIIIAWTVTFFLCVFLECKGRLVFDPKDYVKYCGAANRIGWAYVGSDIVTDLVTLIFPIPIIMKLHLDMTRKLLALATFMVGALCVGASIAKAYIYIASTLSTGNKDALVIITGLSLWNLVEVQVGIIAACGMTLRPILDFLLPTRYILGAIKTVFSSRKTEKQDELPSFVTIVVKNDLQPQIKNRPGSDLAVNDV